jgi:NAD(P)-dependent dehydrogenase (short-subunit alcohol dehydrogenase family)
VRLRGKTAVVTGAGSGIGRATAVLLAREGAEVVVHSRSRDHAEETAAEVERAGGRSRAVVVGRIEHEPTAERLAEVVRDAWPSLDGLVLSAGIDNFEPVGVVSVEKWDEIIATNLRGVFLACRSLLPLVRRPGGSIVHIASASALVGSPGMAAYSASKGGMVSLAREMAIDYAAEGIRVNSICPGSIDTPMLRAGFEARDDPAAAEQACIGRHPIGRLGRAEDVAYGALYLVSDEASFVTGTTLVIDGGYTAV